MTHYCLSHISMYLCLEEHVCKVSFCVTLSFDKIYNNLSLTKHELIVLGSTLNRLLIIKRKQKFTEVCMYFHDLKIDFA